jgi:hypothetical protein
MRMALHLRVANCEYCQHETPLSGGGDLNRRSRSIEQSKRAGSYPPFNGTMARSPDDPIPYCLPTTCEGRINGQVTVDEDMQFESCFGAGIVVTTRLSLVRMMAVPFCASLGSTTVA